MMAPLKMGMVGGGFDALIGAWHRRAVAIDGGIDLVAGALASTRGHPEAFNEAFANIHANAADTMRACQERRVATELELDFPTAANGVRGLAFIAAVVECDANDATWTALKDYLS